MIALFLILFVVFTVWLLRILLKEPPVPTKYARQSFTVPAVYGATLTAEIVVDERYLVRAEEIVNRFGGSRTQRSLLPGNLDQSDNLFRHLQHYGEMTGHTVISARLNLPPVKPQRPTMAESLVSTFKAKEDASRAIAKAAGIDVDITGKLQGYAKDRIDRIFHDDDRA